MKHSLACAIYCVREQMFEILYFIMSSSAELKQKYHFTALFLDHITYCPLWTGVPWACLIIKNTLFDHERKMVSYWNLKTKEINSVLVFLGLSCYFSYINHRVHSYFTVKPV